MTTSASGLSMGEAETIPPSPCPSLGGGEGRLIDKFAAGVLSSNSTRGLRGWPLAPPESRAAKALPRGSAHQEELA